MCGRFVRTTSPERLASTFGAVLTTDRTHPPRYNVAPSQDVLALIDRGGRRIGELRWGFVPPWAPDPARGIRPINARVEGVTSSRMFRASIEARRCIVPVDGWYEWREEDGHRQPYLIEPLDGPLPIAAVWSSWRDRTGVDVQAGSVTTVALLTTTAQGLAAEVHDRMPLSVPWDLLDDWLQDAGSGRARAEPEDVASLLASVASHAPEVRVTRVSRRVNDVRNDDASLLGPEPA
jgi:putative SOS response-associated peptidase YedK